MTVGNCGKGDMITAANLVSAFVVLRYDNHLIHFPLLFPKFPLRAAVLKDGTADCRLHGAIFGKSALSTLGRGLHHSSPKRP